MRNPIYAMPPSEARALLAQAPAVHIATTDALGAPIFRTVNAVVVDDAVCFHGAPAGEKSTALGRPCVVAWDETIASIPSHFVDPERACPATTYYRSVQVHGVLERVDDAPAKARVLQALMEKYQPEGQHRPITAVDPMYRKVVAGLLVVRVALTSLTGKGKLGQNRTPTERSKILGHLWARGGAGDLRAIELVRAANPGTPTPPALETPGGTRLVVWPGAEDARDAAALLEGTYWNEGLSPERIAAAQLGATAWLGVRDEAGRLVGTARVVSDLARRAWVYDVAVAPDLRGTGLGTVLMERLLDHPTVRGVREVWLGTRDAHPFYERLGFVRKENLPPGPYVSTAMVRFGAARAAAG